MVLRVWTGMRVKDEGTGRHEGCSTGDLPQNRRFACECYRPEGTLKGLVVDWEACALLGLSVSHINYTK